jgi:hypothetical protein
MKHVSSLIFLFLSQRVLGSYEVTCVQSREKGRSLGHVEFLRSRCPRILPAVILQRFVRWLSSANNIRHHGPAAFHWHLISCNWRWGPLGGHPASQTAGP